MTEIALVWDVETARAVAGVLEAAAALRGGTLGPLNTLALTDLRYRLALADSRDAQSQAGVVQAGIDLTETR